MNLNIHILTLSSGNILSCTTHYSYAHVLHKVHLLSIRMNLMMWIPFDFHSSIYVHLHTFLSTNIRLMWCFAGNVRPRLVCSVSPRRVKNDESFVHWRYENFFIHIFCRFRQTSGTLSRIVEVQVQQAFRRSTYL